ncbi:hypothetical protein HF086_015074 [Spodoptera exigua]|uniref:Uncharacterized protein n=1 Tax=Spodoptera exigua TaxID=7107 RepID=A0A922MQT9_SPOEX|nr:hypothetical protein HF086_015074 [Spodoptera exigua]
MITICLTGGADTKKYHHLGFNKMRKSLSDSDARLFESFVRISIQIVWIALGRKKFHLIELETHRILKTDLFNPVKHRLKSEYMHEMMPAERATLSTRLKYFRMVVAGTEETLEASGYTLGIIGLPRSHFDTMLRPLPPPCDLKSKSSM